jgi:hypothetical protein
MLEITEHAKVFTAHDKYVGKVDRIVMDPITRMVSHIVVHKGIFLREDKVVPIENVTTATEERINLKRGSHMDDFPSFIEQHYVTLDEAGDESEAGQDPNQPQGPSSAPFVWYGPYGMGTTMFESSMRTVTERNIPERAIALEPGAMVCALGRAKFGALEEVITTDAGVATHIIVTMSDPSLDRKAIPMHWVDEISENEIHLGVTAWMIEAIEPYDPSLSSLPG